MGGTILWKYCAWMALFSSPAVPLAFAWLRLARGARNALDLVLTAVATVSLCWFDAAVMNIRFLGSLYGISHYAIIGGNWIAVLVCGVVSFAFSRSVSARAQRIATGVACLLLFAEWSFLGIANR
ncbi:MAG TPA: hypothetical protein VL991_08715 [Terracidiphilus sp.]|nr:hypothetical protein [Terracidiphilus sp.]